VSRGLALRWAVSGKFTRKMYEKQKGRGRNDAESLMVIGFCGDYRVFISGRLTGNMYRDNREFFSNNREKLWLKVQ
jgi:hypothetical protein